MEKKPKVLIACEYSGIVRNAFANTGCDVTSCDLLPGETNLFHNNTGKHYCGNILDIINDGYNAMIGFPPCTFLSFVGNKYLKNVERLKKREEALEFFKLLYNAPIEYICLENPLGYINSYKKYDQIIHPFQFGEPFQKRTCLWLKNLPTLQHTNVVTPNKYFFKSGKPKYATDVLRKGSGSNVAKNRSKFWHGIANAMAEQWTPLIK